MINTDPIFATQHTITKDGIFSFVLPPQPDDMVEITSADDAYSRRSDEGTKAYTAFRRYVALKGIRTLRRAYAAYQSELRGSGTGAEQDMDGAKTKNADPPSYFRGWASAYQWQHRAEIIDRESDELVKQAYRQEIEEGIRNWREITQSKANIKNTFFVQMAAIIKTRLLECAARDKATREGATEIVGNKTTRVMLTPLSDLWELARLMRYISAVSDSGKLDGADSNQIRSVIHELQKLEKEYVDTGEL